jgi:hypothetical protein
MRTSSVERNCPRCGSSVVIPLGYPHATYENPGDMRPTILDWDGCPKRWEPGHGDVTDAEWNALI